jgi:hypothetical protein
MQRMTENEKIHPHGILVVAAPSGAAGLSPANLLRQLLGDVAAALAAALVLAIAGIGRYAARLAAVVLIGIFAGCAILLPYWNWYGFPADFTVASLCDVALRAAACGLVLAAIVHRKVKVGFAAG